MKVLFISGAPNTGKSTTIYHICTYLLGRGYTKIIDILYNKHVYLPPTSFPPTPIDDFACLLEKDRIKVLIHTATDDRCNIDWLVNNINKYTPDIVITSCRDYNDWVRDYLCTEMKLTNGYTLIGSGGILYVESFL